MNDEYCMGVIKRVKFQIIKILCLKVFVRKVCAN